MRPLIDIVKDYAVGKGYDSAHGFDRLIRSAIKGLRELSYDVDGINVEDTYTLDSDNTIPIPNDYIRHVLVRGITNGGHVDLILSTSRPKKDDCGDDRFTNNNCEFKGTFVENRAAGRLEFGTEYTFTKIWMKYVANPQKVDGKYLVHEFLEEPLLLWMDYDLVRFKDSVSRGEKQMRHIAYANAKSHARKRLKTRRREELQASIRRNRKRFKG